ncbi:MAG: hypothetical protein R3B09_31540 [Nannocystaceae bacterium]
MWIRRGFVGLLSTALLAIPGCKRGGDESRRPKANFGIAPPFTGVDALGQSVSLDHLLVAGPAVLVFYRGHW